jgi:hypothetical protein
MEGYQPIPGVGMAMPAADTQPDPITGRLSDPAPNSGIGWMFRAAQGPMSAVVADHGWVDDVVLAHRYR